MSEKSEPSEALRQQLETDAGPHPTPDQQRAAEKRRAAAGLVKEDVRTAPPVERKSAPVKKQTT